MAKYRSDEYICLNKQLVPYNIFIAIIAAACIIVLLVGSFFSLNLKVTITDEFINEYAPKDSQIDFSTMKGEEISLSIRLETVTILSTITKGSKDTVEKFVGKITTSLVGQLEPLVKLAIRAVAASVVLDAIRDSDIDISEEDLAKIDFDGLNNVFDTLIDVSKTDEDVKNVANNYLEGQLDKFDDISPADKELILEAFDENFDEVFAELKNEVADENGNITMDSLLTYVLDAMSDGNVLPNSAVMQQASNDEATQTAEERLTQIINDLLAPIVDGSSQIIDIVMYVLYAVIAINVLSWFIVLLSAVLRTTLAKKKVVGTKWVQATGWIMFTLLVLIPTIALLIVPNLIPAFPSFVTAGFMSATIAPFIGAILLMILGFCGLNKTKKKIKTEAKASN